MEGVSALGGKHTIQYIDNILQSCTPDIYVILVSHVPQ